jgi:hypothetical protein
VELDTNHPAGTAERVVVAEEKMIVPGRSAVILRKTA